MPLREWWRGLHAPRLGEAPWSPARRVLFRVLFVFVLLFLSLPAPLNLAPGLSGFTNPIWTSFALRLGAVLGLQVPIHGDTGSSDGMRDWLILASVLVVSIAVAAVWSAVQRAPTRHGKLLDFLELYCRVSLVQMLAVYGAIKVLALQFPLPDAATLLLSYGESSPMKLMWTFMGASPTYQRFGGWMEVFAAALLLTRRTRTLGALLACGVMGNVFVMNLCYDIPVKIGSGTLLGLAMFLAALDAPRLLSMLVLNRPTEPVEYGPEFWGTGRWVWLRRGLTGLFMGSSFVFVAMVVAGGPPTENPKSISGAYEILSTEGVEGLSRVAFSTRDGRVFFSDGRSQSFLVKQNFDEHRLTLSTRSDGAALDANLVRSEGTEPNTFTFSGSWNGSPVQLHTRWMDLSTPRLLHRGFHWVNEAPYQP